MIFYATYFLEHVGCSSHCAITRLVPLPALTTELAQPTRRNGGLLVRADAEKKSLMMIRYIAIEFEQARQIGLKVKTILGT